MATTDKGGKNVAQKINPESSDTQAERIVDVQADGVSVDLSLDEGAVYADPNELIIDASDSAVVGFDQGGVYTPKDVGVIATPVQARGAGKGKDDRIVFTSTRYPEQKIAIVKEDEDGRKVRSGTYIKFNSTKLFATPEQAKQLEAMNLPGVYREPSGYVTEARNPTSDKMFRHESTGFQTMSKAAYEDWVNNSEWSAVPGRGR